LPWRGRPRLLNLTISIQLHAYYFEYIPIEDRQKYKQWFWLAFSIKHLKTPDGPIEDPSIAYTPEPILTKKKVEYKGAFATLSKRSTLKILDYTETSGSGKILGKRRREN
jgi:hypothetical protein